MELVDQSSFAAISFHPAIGSPIASTIPAIAEDVPLWSLESVNQIKVSDVGFDFSSYGVFFGFELFDIDWHKDSNTIILHARMGGQLSIDVVLSGTWIGVETPHFHLREIGLNLVHKSPTPLAGFVSSTMWALMGLSVPLNVRVPSLKYDISTAYSLPPKEISRLLQERQLAYRLIVIESSIGVEIPFPAGFVSAQDVENIAFSFHAICDREFDWPTFQSEIPWHATEEAKAWLPDDDEPHPVTFSPEFFSRTIFGIEVPIGLITGQVFQAKIDNLKEVKDAISRLDNEIVKVKFRSLTGFTRMKSLRVPHFLIESCTPELQDLIRLESVLDELAAEKYFALAAATLEGLNDEQRLSAAEAPEINFDDD